MAAIHLTSINPTATPSSSSFPTHPRAGFLPSVSPNTIAASAPKLRSAVARWGIRRREVGTGFRSSRTVVSSLGKLSETELVSVPEDPRELVGTTLPTGAGVYGVYDGSGALQFIGITRNIAGSVVSHGKSLPELCRSVKVGVIDEPAPDRAVLTNAWKAWMEEHIEATGCVPPGNESGNNTWLRQPQKKPDLRLTPGRHVKLAVPLVDLIDRLVKEKRVVAFIKGSRGSPQCGFSQRVVGILESEGVDFECVNVLDEEYNSGLREALKTYSNWPTFPQIFVKGELLGGCDILTAMAEKRELGPLLEK